MPAKGLIPALFMAGIVAQSLLLRFEKGKKRFYLIFISLAIIILCETAGMVDNGLAETVIVAFSWPLLLGTLPVLAVYGLSIRIGTKQVPHGAAPEKTGAQRENTSCEKEGPL